MPSNFGPIFRDAGEQLGAFPKRFFPSRRRWAGTMNTVALRSFNCHWHLEWLSNNKKHTPNVLCLALGERQFVTKRERYLLCRNVGGKSPRATAPASLMRNIKPFFFLYKNAVIAAGNAFVDVSSARLYVMTNNKNKLWIAKCAFAGAAAPRTRKSDSSRWKLKEVKATAAHPCINPACRKLNHCC